MNCKKANLNMKMCDDSKELSDVTILGFLSKRETKIANSIMSFNSWLKEHKKFPKRSGATCHLLSCKALEFFRLNNVNAHLVHYNPEKTKFKHPSMNHVWVEIVGYGYYDAKANRSYRMTNHPYGDKKMLSEPKYDRLVDIVGAKMVKAWEE